MRFVKTENDLAKYFIHQLGVKEVGFRDRESRYCNYYFILETFYRAKTIIND